MSFTRLSHEDDVYTEDEEALDDSPLEMQSVKDK